MSIRVPAFVLRCPVSLTLSVGVVVIYLLTGAAEETNAYQTYPQLLIGVFRHGDLNHLALNAALALVGGRIVEPKIGSIPTLLLVGLSAALCTLAELLIAGPGFVGLSGVAYALFTHALLINAPKQNIWLVLLCLVGALAAEWRFLNDTIAIYAHATGAALGAISFMLTSLFGQKGPHLKAMEWAHVSKVIPIIAETDEDDAAEAEGVFLDRGFQNMFVLVERGQVLGLTGFDIDEAVPDLAWLSWTYLGEEYIGQGLGGQMLNDLLGKLAKQGIRKIFIETSDYQEFGKKIYASAHRLYEDFGAKVELTVSDYHAPGEAKLIYGLDNPEADAAHVELGTSGLGLALIGVEKASETDNVAGFRWEEIQEGLSGIDFVLGRARDQGFRMAVMPIPGDISRANAAALETHGFRQVGQLTDYYGPGLGQDWWTHDLAIKQD